MTKQEMQKKQKELRQKKAQEFGEIGLKKDCQFFNHGIVHNSCTALYELYCQCEVCYFYKKNNSDDKI